MIPISGELKFKVERSLYIKLSTLYNKPTTMRLYEKKMVKRRIGSLLFAISFLVLSGCQVIQEGKTLKLAHGLDPTHPVSQAMVYMAESCDSISGGKLKIDIYPSGQLGSEQQCVELLQIGSLAITKVSAAVLEGFTEEFKALGLPYIFKSKEHSFKVLDGEIGKDLLKSTEPFWIRGLCFYDAGART